MIKYLFIVCFTLLSIHSKAHQPDISSTMLIEQGPNKWVLQIRVALTALEYEVKTNFGDNAYASPEEFQALVLEHVQKNISIVFNKQKVELKNGYVKLGHEASVVFELTGAPETIKTIQVTNHSFKDIHNSTSALMVLKKGITKEQFLLNSENQHSAKLKFSNAEFILLEKKASNSTFAFQLSITSITILSIFIGILFYFRRRNKRLTSF